MGALRRIVTGIADALLRRPRRVRPARFGGREFTRPELLTEAVLPPNPGLYAIHVRSWWGGMKVLQFGASDNLNEAFDVEGDLGFVHWLGERKSRRGVWVSYHLS